MKKLLFFLTLLISIPGFSQDERTVTLVVNGQGETQYEARQNALRTAIEQAFGSFISSKTEILNDKLIKDEIVSVTNGNIQNYEVISEVQIPNGQFATLINAKVSVSKLSSFIESKGFAVELNGKLLALNVKQQIINETNESKSMDNISFTCKKILDKSCEFNLTSGNPIQQGNNNQWGIPLKIGIKFNKNIQNFNEFLMNSLIGLSMSQGEISSYKSLGKETYTILINNNLPMETDIAKLKSIGFKNPNLLSSNQLNYQITHLDEIIYESNNFEKVEKKFNQIKSKNKEGEYKLKYFTKFNWLKLEYRSKTTINAVIDLILYTRHSILNFEINNGLKSTIPLNNLNDFELIYDNIFPFVGDNDNKRSLFANYSNGIFIDDDSYRKYNTYQDLRGGKILRKTYEIGEFRIDKSKYYEQLTFQRNVKEIYDINGNISKKEYYDLKIDLDDYVNSKYNIYELNYLDILSLLDLEKIKKYSIRAID